MAELIVVFLILLLVFGASRLPQIGDGIGRAIRNFKRGVNEDEDINVAERKISADSSAKSAREAVREAEEVE